MRLIDAHETNMQIVSLYNNETDKAVKSLLRQVMEIIQKAPTIAPLPNDPLTLEELREMCGCPVWIERHDGGQSRWAIVGDCDSLYGVYFGTARGGLRLPYDECGKNWIPYRNKMEEGQNPNRL